MFLEMTLENINRMSMANRLTITSMEYQMIMSMMLKEIELNLDHGTLPETNIAHEHPHLSW